MKPGQPIENIKDLKPGQLVYAPPSRYPGASRWYTYLSLVPVLGLPNHWYLQLFYHSTTSTNRPIRYWAAGRGDNSEAIGLYSVD